MNLPEALLWNVFDMPNKRHNQAADGGAKYEVEIQPLLLFETQVRRMYRNVRRVLSLKEVDCKALRMHRVQAKAWGMKTSAVM
jgi:hypothetical protein